MTIPYISPRSNTSRTESSSDDASREPHCCRTTPAVRGQSSLSLVRWQSLFENIHCHHHLFANSSPRCLFRLVSRTRERQVWVCRVSRTIARTRWRIGCVRDGHEQTTKPGPQRDDVSCESPTRQAESSLIPDIQREHISRDHVHRSIPST